MCRRDPSHHSGERISRRASGASGGEAERRLARAGDRTECQWQFRARPRPRCAAAIRPLPAEKNQGCSDRSDLRVAQRHPCPRHCAPRACERRCAFHRLRPCRKRRRGDSSVGQRARLRRSRCRRRARPTSPRMSTFSSLVRPPRAWARWCKARSHRRSSCANSGSTPAPTRCDGAPAREQAANITAAVARLTEAGRTGMGELFKVMAICGIRNSVHCRDLHPYEMPRSVRCPRWTAFATLSSRAKAECPDGIYASLNSGVGSNDDPGHVAENRARMAQALGVDPARLITAFQIHSPACGRCGRALDVETRPKADAIVTRTPGLAIGVSTADCGPLLFADPQARVIGAAHAGWRGAFSGVIEGTVAAMEKLGADRDRISVALGPLIRKQNYEVSQSFVDEFLRADESVCAFFFARQARWACDVRFARIYRLATRTERDRTVRGYRDLHLFRPATASTAIGARCTAPNRIMGGTSTRLSSAG